MSSKPTVQGGLLDSLKKAGVEAGGLEGIEKILTTFYGRMAKDPLIGFFFFGKNLSHVIAQQKLFLGRAMGLTPAYDGKTPREAHRQLPPILKGHFDRRLLILREVLAEFGLSQESIQAWVNFEDSFRKGIVEDEGPLSERTKYKERK